MFLDANSRAANLEEDGKTLAYCLHPKCGYALTGADWVRNDMDRLQGACKFCKVSIVQFELHKPEKWIQQRWSEPGIWVLFGLLLVLYLPCLKFAWMDHKDFKPIWKRIRTFLDGQTWLC